MAPFLKRYRVHRAREMESKELEVHDDRHISHQCSAQHSRRRRRFSAGTLLSRGAASGAGDNPRRAYVALAGRLYGPAAVNKGNKKNGGGLCLISTGLGSAQEADADESYLHIPAVESAERRLRRRGKWKRSGGFFLSDAHRGNAISWLRMAPSWAPIVAFY
jgi:hypothetical protein